jgi:hypothetical protein
MRSAEKTSLNEAKLRITISHNRPKADMIESVDRSFNQMLQGEAGLPVRLVVKEKSWQGSILSFTLSAKMGLLSSSIKGTSNSLIKNLS